MGPKFLLEFREREMGLFKKRSEPLSRRTRTLMLLGFVCSPHFSTLTQVALFDISHNIPFLSSTKPKHSHDTSQQQQQLQQGLERSVPESTGQRRKQQPPKISRLAYSRRFGPPSANSHDINILRHKRRRRCNRRTVCHSPRAKTIGRKSHLARDLGRSSRDR